MTSINGEKSFPYKNVETVNSSLRLQFHKCNLRVFFLRVYKHVNSSAIYMVQAGGGGGWTREDVSEEGRRGS